MSALAMSRQREPLRIFMSFATSDGAHRHIFTRLQQQHVQAWDYERHPMEIETGTDISDATRRQIERTELFVVLLSEAALRSRWVVREVEHALSLQKRRGLAILPVVDRSAWGKLENFPVFAALADVKVCHVDMRSLVSLEQVIVEICSRLGVEHQPPITEDPRLPFMAKLYEEIRARSPKTPYGSELYQRLSRVLDEFQAAFESGAHREALTLSRYFNQILEHEYPEHAFYYPYIVEAICLVALEHFEQALAALTQVEQGLTGTSGPYPDENLFAAFGYVYFQQGKFSDAERAYEKATRRRPDGAASRSALLVTRLRLGRKVDLTEAFRAIDNCALLTGDAPRIALTKAIAHVLAGDEKTGLRDLVSLTSEPDCPVEAYMEYAKLLLGRGRALEATNMLAVGHRRDPKNGPLLVALADSASEAGDNQAARRYYRLLAATFPTSFQYQYEALRGLWQLGAHSEARGIGETILSDKELGLPVRPHEFFISGAANWVLGRRSRADYDFERSRKPKGDWYYSGFLGRCGGDRARAHSASSVADSTMKASALFGHHHLALRGSVAV